MRIGGCEEKCGPSGGEKGRLKEEKDIYPPPTAAYGHGEYILTDDPGPEAFMMRLCIKKKKSLVSS